jgi:hypothetical protein
MEKLKDDAFFAVSLDGIHLTEDQSRRIDKGIKEVVMREIAQIDHGGDLVVNKKLEANPRFNGLKFPIIFGFWIETLEVFRKRMNNGIK